jgi:hypothetical protein
MRSASQASKPRIKPADPIIVHPDVRKMLLTAKAYAEGGRALMSSARCCWRKSTITPMKKSRKDSGEMLALLTPIVKAFITDNGHISTNACMQVFGGHGFIKETGMEQFVRDNRINMIYEGTNTIPVTGPAGPQGAGQQRCHAEEVRQTDWVRWWPKKGSMRRWQSSSPRLPSWADQMTKFTTELGFKGFQNADEVGAAAVDYLRVAGHLVFGYFWARMAQVALAPDCRG